MKLTKMIVAVAALAAITVSAADIEVPILYKHKNAKQTPHQMEAAGFKETETAYIFAFQIKDLQKFLKNQGPFLSLYINMDNNLNTGRYPKGHGWDFQFNSQLGPKTLQANMYNDPKDSNKCVGLNAKYKIIAVNNTLFYYLNKRSVKPLQFAPVFTIRTGHGSKALITEDSIERNVPVDPKKPLGMFPDKLKID